MTIAQFQDLPLQEQEEALKQGEYISTREYYRQKLDLYSLFDFFVEVWHDVICRDDCSTCHLCMVKGKKIITDKLR